MSNSLQVFTYKEQEVRTAMIDGEIWFVASDICHVLELSNTTEALKALDEDEKNTLRISEGNRGNPTVNVISEPGLYALVLRSNKPEAKQFSRWVRHDVLPQIRKTGSYSNGNNTALPLGVIEGARAVFETAGITGNQATLALDKVFRSYTGRSALQMGEISLTAPTKKQILTPTEIGAEFGLNAQRVNEILAGAGFQHKIAGKWEALPPGEPYAVMLDTGKKHSDGTSVRQLKWDSSILTAFNSLSA